MLLSKKPGKDIYYMYLIILLSDFPKYIVVISLIHIQVFMFYSLVSAVNLSSFLGS